MDHTPPVVGRTRFFRLSLSAGVVALLLVGCERSGHAEISAKPASPEVETESPATNSTPPPIRLGEPPRLPAPP